MNADDIADEAVNVIAIGALVVVSLEGSADPTLVTTAIAGLGGYRMRQRAASNHGEK